MIDAATERRKKRPAPNDGNLPKVPRPNDPPASSQRLRRRERLQMIQNRIVLRDDALNITRPLTNEEIARKVEITNCAYRFCSRERKGNSEDDSIYVPGTAPRPSSNSAVPTLTSHMVPQLHVRRTPLSADLSAITAVVKLDS